MDTLSEDLIVANFIGGSDARIIMGKDEKALLGCGAKSEVRRPHPTCRAY